LKLFVGKSKFNFQREWKLIKIVLISNDLYLWIIPGSYINNQDNKNWFAKIRISSLLLKRFILLILSTNYWFFCKFNFRTSNYINLSKLISYYLSSDWILIKISTTFLLIDLFYYYDIVFTTFYPSTSNNRHRNWAIWSNSL
jgi:hypothetical protein